MTWESDDIPNFNWTQDTDNVTIFQIFSNDESLSGLNLTGKIIMSIGSNTPREFTFKMRFRKVPYFTTQLAEIYLRPGIEKNVTIPEATDDQNLHTRYSETNDLPAGASVQSTVENGNTFEFKDITAGMNGTYEFNIFACTAAACNINNSYSIPVIINNVPSSGNASSSYSYHAHSNQNLSLVGMAVDTEGDDVSVSIYNP